MCGHVGNWCAHADDIQCSAAVPLSLYDRSLRTSTCSCWMSVAYAGRDGISPPPPSPPGCSGPVPHVKTRVYFRSWPTPGCLRWRRGWTFECAHCHQRDDEQFETAHLHRLIPTVDNDNNNRLRSLSPQKAAETARHTHPRLAYATSTTHPLDLHIHHVFKRRGELLLRNVPRDLS